MNIKDIAKQALLTFKSNGYVFTPKEYEEVFCKLAKQYRVIVEDCNKVAKFLSKLDNRYQVIAKNYNIKNLDELIVFLINYLNRQNSDKEKESIEELFLYTKRALDVIVILPIVKSQKIALKHLDFLKPYMNEKEWEKLRNEWIDFLDSFDDGIIKKASKIINTNSKDALEIIEILLQKLENQEIDLSHLTDALIYALTPSYVPFMSDEIAALKRELKTDPNVILTPAFAEDLKFLTDKRIKLDKEELKRKLKDLEQITERLSIKILNILNKSADSSTEIKNITLELQNWRKEGNFDSIKGKLLSIATSLDKGIDEFVTEMKKEDEEIEKLKAKINFLEKKVKKLSKEVKTDFLTNMANKKALKDELKRQENIYKRYKNNYSVVFFDIDHFKRINDTYGHDAGDVILKSLGLLFRRYTRDIDMIGRFGGEEFVAILPNTNKNGAYKFAEKLRDIVSKTKFMYKKTRIKVTISGGVASRDEVNSSDELLKKADKRLYLAKQNGRNRICADDKCESEN